MSTAATRTACLPSGEVVAWVSSLAWELRPPTGTARVLVGAGAEAVAEPYLDARARVVGVGSSEGDPRYHARADADGHGLPRARRDEDADLIVLPWLEEREGTWAAIGGALAAGGVAVLGVRGASRAIEQRAAQAGLAVARVEQAGADVVIAVADRRVARALPRALAEADRTMSVDRAQVLRAVEREPWRMAGTGRTAELLAALAEQLARGEPELRALPWRPGGVPAGDPAELDVLVVMPHPDDESVYAGGTLAGLTAAGQRVKVVVATAGAGGRGGPDLAPRRARELLEAARVLGVCGVRCLGWADFGKYRDDARTVPVTAGDALRRWELPRALEELVAEIRRERPRVLLGLDPEVDPNYSLHGHHLGLGVLLAVAFHAAADEAFVPWRGRAWACTEHRVMAPTSDGAWSVGFEIDRAVKQRALRAHASQAYSTARVLEALGDPRRPAVELTRRVQARAVAPWWMARRRGTSLDAGIDWAGEAARVCSQARARGAVVEALRRREHAAGGDDPAVEISLRRLAREDAVAVVTGQQVGLLGGPAYTLAKALTAVALARRLRRHGVEAVPVFWMATQDHDLEEVQRVPRLGATTLRLGLRDAGTPVGEVRLGDGIEALGERWAAELPAGHDRAVVEWVRRTHRPEHGFGAAFEGLLREATRGTGLLVLDPSDPAIAKLARPLLQRAVLEAPAVDRALAEARDRLRMRGEREVVPTGRDATLVFALDEHGVRRRVTRHDDVGERVAAMEYRPERVSAAALLRPLVQDAVLPTIAYVAGPTERRYLEQTHELYAWAGLPRPQVLSRVSLGIALARDVGALAEVGGLDGLRADPRPLERIGRTGLGEPARAWLDAVEATIERLDEARGLACAGHGTALDRAALRERLGRLDALALAALPSLPRTARGWARASAALGERATAVLDGPDPIPSRAITRLRHALVRARRSILRDGRRARPEAIAAWERVGPVPGPPERRMTVAELLARGGAGLAHGVLAALETELSPGLDLQLGSDR